MKKTLIAALVASLLVVTLGLSVHAKVLQNEKIPVAWGAVIPCTGDLVLLEGKMHILFAMTVDGNGGFHVKSHSQPQGLQGEVVLPLISPNLGAKYNGVGVTQWSENMKPGLTYTMVNNYRMIGQGKAPNLNVHEVWHLTINANGVITANFYKGKITCK